LRTSQLDSLNKCASAQTVLESEVVDNLKTNWQYLNANLYLSYDFEKPA